MRVRLLGTAAGGGFPQWNCGCPNCRAVRSGEARASARTQTCVAVSADGGVVLGRCVARHPGPDRVVSSPAGRTEVRGSAVEGVLLAGADLDHVLGLFLLREGGASASTPRRPCAGRSATACRLDTVLGCYARLEWREPPERPGPLRLGDGGPSGLLYAAFPVPGKPPRYMRAGGQTRPGDCIGYRFEDERPPAAGWPCCPGPPRSTPDVLDRLRGCDVAPDRRDVLERARAGGARHAGDTPASVMGHLPVGGSWWQPGMRRRAARA